MSIASVITAAIAPTEKSKPRKTVKEYREQRQLEFDRAVADARAHCVELLDIANSLGTVTSIPAEINAKLEELGRQFISVEPVRLLETVERTSKFTAGWNDLHRKKHAWINDVRATRPEVVGSIAVQLPKIESDSYRQAIRISGHMIATDYANLLDLVEASQAKQSDRFNAYLADCDEIVSWSPHLEALLRMKNFLEQQYLDSRGLTGGGTAPIRELAVTIASALGHTSPEDGQLVQRALLVSKQWVEARTKN